MGNEKFLRVKTHFRKNKYGVPRIVHPYVRRLRKKGSDIKFKRAGIFYVAHDELGNFRGSKVVKDKKDVKKGKVKKKKRSRSSPNDVFNFKLDMGSNSYSELVKKKKKELGLS